MEKQSQDENELLLNVILAALEGYANSPESNECENNSTSDEEIEDAGKSGKIEFNYLLGQSIRQWQIPKDNWHTSKAAQTVWKGIVNQHPNDEEKFATKLLDFQRKRYLNYKESFLCKAEPEWSKVPRFKGTTKDFKSINLLPINGGESHVFNEIFIAEHTTPVSDIKDALKECYLANKGVMAKNGTEKMRDEVRKILNMIHITQMLKIEDRRINKSSGRLKEMYGKNNIYNTLSSKTPSEVFEEIRDQYYYQNLQYTKKSMPNEADIEYQKALQIANEYEWAKAIKLKPDYKIEIL